MTQSLVLRRMSFEQGLRATLIWSQSQDSPFSDLCVDRENYIYAAQHVTEKRYIDGHCQITDITTIMYNG